MSCSSLEHLEFQIKAFCQTLLWTIQMDPDNLVKICGEKVNLDMSETPPQGDTWEPHGVLP